MSIKFNSSFLPFRAINTFGFVQTTQSQECYTIPPNPVSNCEKCGSITFPLKDGENKCPICNPDLEFIPKTVKIGDGIETTRTHFLVIDIRFKKEMTINIMKSFFSALDVNDSFVIIILEPRVVLLYMKDNIPTFYLVNNESDFEVTNYFVIKVKDVVNIDEMINSIHSIYSVFGGKLNVNIDLLESIKLILKQIDEKPFVIYYFLAGNSVPLSIEKTEAASRSIAKLNGVIHFGAYNDFTKLTGIASKNFGCVFKMNENVSEILTKLYNLSKTFRLKVIIPKSFEVLKNTGGVGNIKETEFFKLIDFEKIRGCSCRLGINYDKINGISNDKVNVIELTQTNEGEFMTVHKLRIPKSQEEYNKSLDEEITNSIILKGFSSDILKGSWKGEDWDVLMYKIRNSNQEKYILSSNLIDLSGKQDKAILILYYDLLCLSTTLKNKLVKINNGYVLINPPNLIVYTDEQINIDEIFESEWPLNIKIIKNLDKFLEISKTYKLSEYI